jgi:protein-disulfide isomerase
MSVIARRIAVLGALLGVFASAYLLIDYVWGSGICLTGSGCDTVRLSTFAYPLGIPMPLLGLGYYALATAFIGLAPGSLAERCLLSAIASVLLAGGALAAWWNGRSTPGPVGRSGRARRQAEDARVADDRSVRSFSLVTAGLLGVAFAALVIAPALAGQKPGTVDVAAAGNPVLGSGPVQIVVFSDFQCPACAVAAPSLGQLAADGRITLTYRFFPLTRIHANAHAAALAALAAAEQDRFWQFHDQLFARQQTWAGATPEAAQEAFARIAADIGLDVGRWQADLAKPELAARVEADVQNATELGLAGTPSIFVDGQRYNGRFDYASLSAAIPTPS